MKLRAMTHRKFLQLFLLSTLWLTALTTPAASTPGTTYYIDVNHPQAEDSSDHGNINKPWKTIQYALEQLQAGDILFIRGGVYNEKIVRTRNSGTEEAPITVKAYPGEEVVWQGGRDGTLWHVLSCQWWIIEGIIFENRIILGNGPDEICEHFTTLNCQFRDSAGNARSDGNPDIGAYEHGGGFVDVPTIPQAIEPTGAQTYRTYLPVVVKAKRMRSYYIDATGGDDSNDGRSEDRAWRTLNKVRTEFANGTFSGGDSILFKRGQTWTATNAARLHVRNVSGTSEQTPLYIGAYGTGDKPLIDGKDAGLWTCILCSGVGGPAPGPEDPVPVVGPVDYVVVEDLAITGSRVSGVFLNGVHHWTLRNLTIGEDTNTQGAAIQIGGSSQHITIDNCDLTGPELSPLYIGHAYPSTPLDESSYITLVNSRIRGASSECIDLKPWTHHITIENNILSDTGGEVVSLRGNNHIVRGNVISNPAGGAGIAAWFVYGTGNNHLIENNLIKNIHGSGPGVYGEGIMLAGSGHIIRNNTIVNCRTGINLYASNVTVRNNILYDATVGIDAARLPDSDYNCFHSLKNDLCLEGRGYFQSVAAACSNNNIECHSITSNPGFLDEIEYKISTDSPCYQAGEGGVSIGYFESVARTPTPTKTPLPTYTPTATNTPLPTYTPTPTPTKTPLPTYTPTVTNTPTSLPTNTPALTSTPTPPPTTPTTTSAPLSMSAPTPTPDATATSAFVDLSIDEPLFAGAMVIKGNGIPGALIVVRDLGDHGSLPWGV